MNILTPLEIPLGGQFKIGNLLATVVSIQNPTKFTLEIQKGLREQYQITAAAPVAVTSVVTVQARLGGRGFCSLVVDAPESIKIGR